jgi:hypothetical protein
MIANIDHAAGKSWIIHAGHCDQYVTYEGGLMKI